MDDMLIMILCCLACADLFGVVWLAVHLEKIEDLIQEVLRWL